MSKADIWTSWVDNHDFSKSSPLFETDADGFVEIGRFGNGENERPVFKRSKAMERMVIDKAETVESDFHDGNGNYEGVIYLMHWLNSDQDVVPLYIGKSGKYQSNGEDLNPNLRKIRDRKSRFARWGYGTAFHLGALSQAYFNSKWESTGEIPKSSKGEWISRIFESGSRQLKREVYLWMKAWEVDDIGPYTTDTGDSPHLEELERQLIELAGGLFPNSLLNIEGIPDASMACYRLRDWSAQSNLGNFE